MPSPVHENDRERSDQYGLLLTHCRLVSWYADLRLLQGLPSKARGPMMQPGASAGVVSSGVAGVFPGGGMGGGLWGAGGASLAGASQPSSQVRASSPLARADSHPSRAIAGA